jgi:chromate transporter
MSDAAQRPSLAEIFGAFAVIGVTSFGGGIVAYLRDALVEKRRWMDEDEFMAALEISQTLPGLNSTNMSVIAGRKLRGAPGAVAAFLGMVLPGAAIVMALGFAYARFRHDPVISLVLAGAAAAAVGLLLQVTLKIGWKQLVNLRDLALVVAVFVLSGILHVSLVATLVAVAPIAIWLNRPRGARGKETS